MIIQGHHVGFVMVSGPTKDRTLWAPRTWHLVRDPTGKRHRKCDIFILPLGRELSLRGAHDGDMDEAEYIHGGGSGLSRWQVVIPPESWFEIGRASNLLYTREFEGKLVDFDHDFSSPQRVEEHRTLPAWRFRFSDGCVVDDFFRKP